MHRLRRQRHVRMNQGARRDSRSAAAAAARFRAFPTDRRRCRIAAECAGRRSSASRRLLRSLHSRVRHADIGCASLRRLRQQRFRGAALGRKRRVADRDTGELEPPAASPSRRRSRPTTLCDPVPSVWVSSAATRSPLIVPSTSEPRSSWRTRPAHQRCSLLTADACPAAAIEHQRQPEVESLRALELLFNPPHELRHRGAHGIRAATSCRRLARPPATPGCTSRRDARHQLGIRSELLARRRDASRESPTTPSPSGIVQSKLGRREPPPVAHRQGRRRAPRPDAPMRHEAALAPPRDSAPGRRSRAASCPPARERACTARARGRRRPARSAIENAPACDPRRFDRIVSS